VVCVWYDGDRPNGDGMSVSCKVHPGTSLSLYNAYAIPCTHVVALPARIIIIILINAPPLARSFVVLLLRLTWRRYRTAHIHASVRVLCLLLGRFQNLPQGVVNLVLDVNRKL
jgi:hypothetical protein